ncbi:hypothetical protein [Pseudorhodoferax soli]|uniref:Uncharacterized protein n=1 Tax=Pseudorhodoferax soli TaxID=545864 RepID=A0A368XGH0_9BURK|nr:hypothetical protein [Pseudorhodoferax soli]RCW66118.1 hypothetical protein DES41_11176 [Pseudorhodoferax soli]
MNTHIPNVHVPDVKSRPVPSSAFPHAKSRPSERGTPSKPFRIYGKVQSPACEREAALLNVAVLGYN